MLEGGFTRDSCIIAFGGGLVGDLAGFVAATILRGVPWINVPTSLLAQVDACVGGKTGINLAQGRNLVGSFYPPRKVIADTQFLETLDKRQVVSGTAEILKYAIGIDRFVYGLLDGRSSDDFHSAEMIASCLRVKARVVSEDEREGSLRKLLNLGHTLGHAIEATCPDDLFHGEAVSIGISFALSLSKRLGYVGQDYLDEARSYLFAAGLPVNLPKGLVFSKIEAFLKVDKKNSANGISWILPTGPGSSEIVSGISKADLKAAYKELKTV